MQITKSTVLVLLATATAVNAFTVAPFAQSATRAMMAPKAPVVFMADDTATAEAGSGVQDDEYTVLDDKGNPIELTLQEKERIFLDALQAYYATGRQLLPDDEFDRLKEDLTWNGSPVVQMNRKEATYLNAMQAYLKGEPVLGDAEFDALKTELQEAGSKFAVAKEPRCYIDTGVCKVTMQRDQFRSNLLYIPAGAVLTSVWLGIIFEIVAFAFFRFNPLVFLLIGAVPIYFGAKYITEEFLFENKLIAYGPCPNCEAEQRIYFGNVLGVEGFGDVAETKCKNCKVEYTVQRSTLRASTLPKA